MYTTSYCFPFPKTLDENRVTASSVGVAMDAMLANLFSNIYCVIMATQ